MKKNTLLLLFALASVVSGQSVTTITEDIPGGSGGVCVDDTGYIYIADFGNKLGGPLSIPGTKIFKVTPEGEVSIFTDGIIGASGNTFGPDGFLYQSNIRGGWISKVSPEGQIQTYVMDGIRGPVDLVFDQDGNLYVANCGNNTIQKITPDLVSTVFTSSSLLRCPNGITLASDGNFYVANFNNGNVVRIAPDGTASEFVTIPGENNGHLFFGNGVLYVVARAANQIYQVTLSGEVSLLAGNGARAIVDGPALEASFSLPNDLGLDPTGRYLYVNDVVNPPTASDLQPMRLRKIDLLDTPTSVEEESGELPSNFKLLQNFPNPFNPETTIQFNLREMAEIELSVFNMQGQKLKTLYAGSKVAGAHAKSWDGTNDRGQTVSSGVYLLKLAVNGSVQQTRKMVLMK